MRAKAVIFLLVSDFSPVLERQYSYNLRNLWRLHVNILIFWDVSQGIKSDRLSGFIYLFYKSRLAKGLWYFLD